MSLGERVKKVRKEQGLTQVEFAKILSISNTFISRVELGKEKPSDTLVKLICKSFDLNYGWLVHGLGDMHISDWKKAQNSVVNSPASDLVTEKRPALSYRYNYANILLIQAYLREEVKSGSEKYYADAINDVLKIIESWPYVCKDTLKDTVPFEMERITDLSDEEFNSYRMMEFETINYLTQRLREIANSVMNEHLNDLLDDDE